MALAPTAPALIGGAPATEQVIWEGVPSMKMMVAEIVGAAVVAVGLPIGAMLLFDPALSAIGGLNRDIPALLDQQRGNIRLVLMVAVALAVALRLVKVAWHAAILRSHRYRVTNQRIVVETGVLSKRVAEVDMRSVEDVQHDETPDEQGPGEPPALGEEDQRRSRGTNRAGDRDGVRGHAVPGEPCTERVDRVTHPCAGVNVEHADSVPSGDCPPGPPRALRPGGARSR